MTARMEMDYNMDSVFQSFKFARKSLNLCKDVVAEWDFFKKLLFIIYLEFIKFIFYKYRDHFVHFITVLNKCSGTVSH